MSLQNIGVLKKVEKKVAKIKELTLLLINNVATSLSSDEGHEEGDFLSRKEGRLGGKA